MEFSTSKNGIKQIIEICKELPEWFTPKAVQNIRKDFKKLSVLKVVKGKKILGFAIYKSSGKSLGIEWLAVKKEFQNQGIGKELIEKLEKLAKKKRLEKIETITLDKSTPSRTYESTRAFYKKQGFKKAKVIKRFWGNKNNALFLEKNL